MTEQHASNEPVDITGKHFDSEKGEWVDDPKTDAANDKADADTTEKAPGDLLAEERAADHNENGTEGR